jgi:hypothetical protein
MKQDSAGGSSYANLWTLKIDAVDPENVAQVATRPDRLVSHDRGLRVARDEG